MSPNISEALLIRLYSDQPLAVDQLSYTQEIKKIVRDYNRRNPDKITESQVYTTLMRLRKCRELPKKGRGKPAAYGRTES